MIVRIDYLNYRRKISSRGRWLSDTSPAEVEESFGKANRHHITAVRRDGDRVVAVFDMGRPRSVRKSHIMRKTYEGTPEEMAYLYHLTEVWSRADAILSYQQE